MAHSYMPNKPSKEEMKKAIEAEDFLSTYIQNHVYQMRTGTMGHWEKVRSDLFDFHLRCTHSDNE